MRQNGRGVERMVEFWGQRAMGCRMRVFAVSEQVVNEFNGLAHSLARGLTEAQGLVDYPRYQGICSPYSSLPRHHQPMGGPDFWEARACFGGNLEPILPPPPPPQTSVVFCSL